MQITLIGLDGKPGRFALVSVIVFNIDYLLSLGTMCFILICAVEIPRDFKHYALNQHSVL